MADKGCVIAREGVRLGAFGGVHRPGRALWGRRMGAVSIQRHGREEGG